LFKITRVAPDLQFNTEIRNLAKLHSGVLTKRLPAIFGMFIAVSVMVACGGGGGGPVEGIAPPPVNNVSPGGFWLGFDNEGETVLAFVTETGRVQLLADGGAQGPGQLTVSNGNEVSGEFQLVTQVGFSFPDGSTLSNCTLSGTVVERQTMSVSAVCTTTLGAVDQFTVMPLVYQEVYERDSSLATVSGLFDGRVVVTDIAADGTLFAQYSINDCVANGRVSIINSDFNLYDVQFTMNNCTGIYDVLNDVSFSGMGILDNTNVPEQFVAPAIGDSSGRLVSWFIFGDRL